MNLIKVKITPHSSFVTFPKGDTIFGHFVYHSFLKGEEIFSNYPNEKPKIIFSDFLPDNYIYKPALPNNYFGVDESQKKKFKKKSWIEIKELKNGIKVQNQESFYPYKELNFYTIELRVRNALNRLTFSTNDSGAFVPFSIEEITFLYQPILYIMFDETFTQEEIVERLNEIGKNGFGKKGTIGKGYFLAELDNDFKRFDEVETDYYITLSPTLLHKSKNIIEKAFYNTFNRFGKYHSSKTPFKKPLLMADSGAVVKLKEKRNWIGGAIDNGIKENSFVQGYSILIPFKLEEAK